MVNAAMTVFFFQGFRAEVSCGPMAVLENLCLEIILPSMLPARPILQWHLHTLTDFHPLAECDCGAWTLVTGNKSKSSGLRMNICR